MSLTAILYDKDREFFDLLGDIFDVTGHKLMVAPDEESVVNFLNTVEVDVFIAPANEIGVWKKNMSSDGKFIVPFFICDSQAQMDSLISSGFSELNTVVKPFNPLELLNKLVMLNKLEVERDLNLYGLINIIISANRRRNSFNVLLKSEKGTCELSIEKGELKTSSCSVEKVRSLFTSKELTIEVAPFSEITDAEAGFDGSKEFIEALLEDTVLDEISVNVAQVKTEEPQTQEEVEDLGEDTRIFSVFDGENLTRNNYYLRIFKGNGQELNFLINAGGLKDWEELKRFLNDSIGGAENLTAVILLSPDVRATFNISKLYHENPKLYVITTSYIRDSFTHMGLAGMRVKLVEHMAFGSMPLTTGHRLSFIPVHHAPHPGSFTLYDEEHKRLFTPEVASSFSANLPEEDKMELLRLYHRVYMPSSISLSKAIDKLMSLDVDTICPLRGHILKGKAYLEELSHITVGADLPLPDSETIKEIIQKVLESLSEEQKQPVKDSIEAFAYIESDKVEEILVEPELLSGILVNGILTSDIDVSTKLSLLKIISDHDVFIAPF